MASKSVNEQLIRNLRFRWREELQSLSDEFLISEYDDFSMSDQFGNDDEHFLKWVMDSLDARK